MLPFLNNGKVVKEAAGETRQKSAEVGNCVCDDYIHGTKWMEMIMDRKRAGFVSK